MSTTTTARPASAKSLTFLTRLVDERDASPGKTVETCRAELATWLTTGPDQKAVSAMIDRLLARPRRAYVATSVAGAYTPYPAISKEVPNSKFAVLSELLTKIPESWAKQEMLFFEVKELRGKRVLRRLTGAPGDFHRSFVPAGLAAELLTLLEDQAFAWQAALTFGKTYTVCGKCSAPLTDDLSRERSIGPICWDMMGPWRVAYEATLTA